MANYIFETMSQEDAAAFRATDHLIFLSSGASAQNVTVTPYAGTLGASGITLSYGTQTLTFPDEISTASASGNLVFNDESTLRIGHNTTDAEPLISTSEVDGSTVIYGLNGVDTITLGAGADYVYGGVGNDVIGADGANGNYHIYGNAAGNPAALTTGQTDADEITTGYGSSYIQGNAGADTISVGTADAGLPDDTDAGNNNVFGGADDDTITVLGGGFNHVNGNKGADTIDAGAATGNNTLRGGQGDDEITAGQGQDVIMGDAGNDHLIAGTTATHLTVMTGGVGDDTFDFSAAGAGSHVNLGTPTAPNLFYQEITDFGNGDDHIVLPNAIDEDNGIVLQGSGVTFTTGDAAQTYAATLLTDDDHVAAIQVGNDTFLFYGSGATDAIKLDGVTASDLETSAFTTVAPAA